MLDRNGKEFDLTKHTHAIYRDDPSYSGEVEFIEFEITGFHIDKEGAVLEGSFMSKYGFLAGMTEPLSSIALVERD